MVVAVRDPQVPSNGIVLASQTLAKWSNPASIAAGVNTARPNRNHVSKQSCTRKQFQAHAPRSPAPLQVRLTRLMVGVQSSFSELCPLKYNTDNAVAYHHHLTRLSRFWTDGTLVELSSKLFTVSCQCIE